MYSQINNIHILYRINSVIGADFSFSGISMGANPFPFTHSFLYFPSPSMPFHAAKRTLLTIGHVGQLLPHPEVSGRICNLNLFYAFSVQNSSVE